MEQRSKVQEREIWQAKPQSSRVTVPMLVTAKLGGREQLVAKIYGMGGGISGRAALKARIAAARAQAFVMLPEALLALKAIRDSFPASGEVNQAKVRQAYVRAVRVLEKVPDSKELLEFVETKEGDGK